MFKYKKRIFLSLAVILVLIVGSYIFSIIQFGKGIHQQPSDLTPNEQNNNQSNEQIDANTNEPPEWTGKEQVNILLLGIDARESEQMDKSRSDTMMVLSVDPVAKQATLFSILRDTYVDIPDRGKDRINAAHAYGGADLAMRTVGEMLDLPIHFYVSIDFQGFIALVDALGGITFEVEKNMRHYDPSDDPAYNIDLKKGVQHLDGNQVLQYVRFRNDTYADLTRTERQRNMLKAIAKEMFTVTSLIKLPLTLEKIEPYIKTNMTLNQMWALGNLGYKVQANELATEQLPPSHLLREETIRNMQVFTFDQARLQAYVQEVLTPDAEDDDNESELPDDEGVQE